MISVYSTTGSVTINVFNITGDRFAANTIDLGNTTWNAATVRNTSRVGYSGLADGLYTLRVNRTGFLNVSGTVTAVTGQNRTVNVNLMRLGELYIPRVVFSENDTTISNTARFYQAPTGEWVNNPGKKHKENLTYDLTIAGNDRVGAVVEIASRLTVNMTANGNKAINVTMDGSNVPYQYTNGTFRVDDSGFFTTTNATVLVVAPAGSDGKVIHIQFDGTVKGDGTGDGIVTAADALIATRTYLRLINIPNTHDYADVAAPLGRFTAADSLMITRNVLGLIDY